jgi:1,6-anhydro-N-acetylmuramate kinase
VRAALIGAEGAGLSSRVEVFAQTQLALSPRVRQLGHALRQRRAPAASAAIVAAQLAESMALLLEHWTPEVAPIWERVLALSVDGPRLWHRAGGLTGCINLCDTARLAELTGQNVIDAFADRDLAQGGGGRPLTPLPFWMLLHDPMKTRLVVCRRQRIELIWLPASRDAVGASRVLYVELSRGEGSATEAAELVAGCLRERLPQTPAVAELVLCDQGSTPALAEALARRLPSIPVVDVAALGVPSAALRPAAAALLGLLHLDQVPANSSAITGARVPRVLGRLTPGSPQNWQRLVRELAAAKPSVIALRSAV